MGLLLASTEEMLDVFGGQQRECGDQPGGWLGTILTGIYLNRKAQEYADSAAERARIEHDGPSFRRGRDSQTESPRRGGGSRSSHPCIAQ